MASRYRQLRDVHVTAAGQLKGQVFNDGRFREGERIVTTKVVRGYSRGDRLFARTSTGTRYEIAGPDGQPWHKWAEPGDILPIETHT